MTSSQEKFTYDFHLAEQAEQDVIEKGEIDYNNFLNEFKKFPWLEQLDKANELEKTSPTITAKDLLNKTELWTSITGDRNQYGYIIGYNFPKLIKRLFKKERTTKWVTMYTSVDTEKILMCYDLFFKRDTAALTTQLKQFDFYGESEVHKQE